MCFRDIRRLNDMAQIGAGEVFEARRSFAPAASITGSIFFVMAALAMSGKARRPRMWSDILEMASGCAAFQCTSGKHARLPNAAPQPIRIENLVKALPIRMRRAEQRAKGGFQGGRAQCKRRGENLKRVAGFSQADLEAVVAKRAREISKPSASGKPVTSIFAFTGLKRLPAGDSHLSHLAQQPLGHLARQSAAIFPRLEQAQHGFMHHFRLLPQIMEIETCERRRPVERL